MVMELSLVQRSTKQDAADENICNAAVTLSIVFEHKKLGSKDAVWLNADGKFFRKYSRYHQTDGSLLRTVFVEG